MTSTYLFIEIRPSVVLTVLFADHGVISLSVRIARPLLNFKKLHNLGTVAGRNQTHQLSHMDPCLKQIIIINAYSSH